MKCFLGANGDRMLKAPLKVKGVIMNWWEGAGWAEAGQRNPVAASGFSGFFVVVFFFK